MSEYGDMTLDQYRDALASNDPTPGGGTAAAVALAQGAALTVMVCNLTEGREKWAEGQDAAKAARAVAEGDLDLVGAVVEETELGGGKPRALKVEDVLGDARRALRHARGIIIIIVGRHRHTHTAPRAAASAMNSRPSACAPGRAQKRSPGCTARESIRTSRTSTPSDSPFNSPPNSATKSSSITGLYPALEHS